MTVVDINITEMITVNNDKQCRIIRCKNDMLNLNYHWKLNLQALLEQGVVASLVPENNLQPVSMNSANIAYFQSSDETFPLNTINKDTYCRA